MTEQTELKWVGKDSLSNMATKYNSTVDKLEDLEKSSSTVNTATEERLKELQEAIDSKTVDAIVDKESLGLDRVNNTSDLEKPMSSATRTFIIQKFDGLTEDATDTEIEGSDPLVSPVLQGYVEGKITAIDSKLTKAYEELNTREALPGKLGMVTTTNAPLVADKEVLSASQVRELINSMDAGMEVGDVAQAFLGIDESLNKRRYLNGQIVLQEQFPEFTRKLKKFLETHVECVCSEAKWQTHAHSNCFGECGKFVVDNENGTIRLPKIIHNYGCTDLTSLAIGTIGRILVAKLRPKSTSGTVTDSDSYWYNYYSDGWLEQGGTIPHQAAGHFLVELKIPYATTDYNIQVTLETDTTGTWGNAYHGVSTTGSKTNEHFYTYIDNTHSKHWRTAGYTRVPSLSDINVVDATSLNLYYIQVSSGHNVVEDYTTTFESNNAFTLLECKYESSVLNNLSWLRSKGQWNDGKVYTSVYNLLLKEYYQPTRDFSIKMHSQDYAPSDFVLNTENMTFRLPLSTLTNKRVLIKSIPRSSDNPIGYNYYSDGWVEQYGVKAGLGFVPNDYVEFKITYVGNPHVVLSRNSGVAYTATNSLATFDTCSTVGVNINRLSGTGFYLGCNGAENGNTPVQDIYWSAAGYASPIDSDTLDSQLRLYYYVGEIAQNAALINIGRLQEKLIDSQDTYKVSDKPELASLAFPSDSSVNLTLAASGTTYTAPADGFVALCITAQAPKDFIGLIPYQSNKEFCGQSVFAPAYTSSTVPVVLRLMLPIGEGTMFVANYKNSGTLRYFKFIYAKGAV